MKITKCAVIAGSLLFCACSRTTAPPRWTPAPVNAFSKPLGLDEALKMAMQKDLRTAEWKTRYGAATAAVHQAWIPPNPTLNLGWEDIGLKDAAGKSQTASSVGVSYPILFWITRPWEIASARHQRAAEEQTILAEKRDLAIEVGRSWLEIAALSRKALLANEAVKEAEDGLRFAQAAAETGNATTLDANRAEAEFLRAKADASDSIAAKRAAQIAFAFALGADRPAYPEVTEMITDDLAPIPAIILQRPQAIAPEVKAAEESAKAAQNDVAVQYAHIVPLTDTQTGAARKNGPDGMSSAYSVDVPIPLFDWNGAGIARAKASEQMAEIAAERSRRQATQHQAESWDRWQAARTKYEQTVMPLLTKNKTMEDSAKSLFEAGEIAYPEYLQLRRDATATNLSTVDAWLEARSSEWSLLCLFEE